MLEAAMTLALLLPAQASAAPDAEESFEVWLCPVHRDEQATGEGVCPVCGRERVRRHLVSVYACPMHAHVEGEHEGACPVCGMSLRPTTRELEWYCPRHRDVVRPEPGACPRDGETLAVRTVPMPHGDHNPRHGGILFMAPDGFHHLEGVLDEDGAFRLYFYDDFTRPLDARSFSARAGERSLEPAPDGSHLRAVLGERPASARPIELTVHVRFEPEGEESRFDFVFAPETASTEEPARPASLGVLVVPEDPAAIRDELGRREAWIRDLLRRGAWPDLFIPALEAKELALALRRRLGPAVEPAVKKIVRGAWLLDHYGDLGDRTKVEEAYRLFEAGMRALEPSDGP